MHEIKKILIKQYEQLNYSGNKHHYSWCNDQLEIFKMVFIFKKSGGLVKIYSDKKTGFNRRVLSI